MRSIATATLSLLLSSAAYAQVVPVYRTPAAPTWGVAPPRASGGATTFRPVNPFRIAEPAPSGVGAAVRVPEPPRAPAFPVPFVPRYVDGQGYPIPSIGPAIPSLALPPVSAGPVPQVSPVAPLAPLALPTYGPSQPVPPTVTFGPPAYYGPPTQAGAAAGAWLNGAGPQPAPVPLAPRPPVNYSGWDTKSLRDRSRIAAERSLWCGPGCTRQRAGQFSRGDWASEADVGPDQKVPENPRTYEATSSRCRAPGCGRVAGAAVGTDGTWRIELYRPETFNRSAERSSDQSVPPPSSTAIEAINRANARRLNGK